MAAPPRADRRARSGGRRRHRLPQLSRTRAFHRGRPATSAYRLSAAPGSVSLIAPGPPAEPTGSTGRPGRGTAASGFRSPERGRPGSRPPPAAPSRSAACRRTAPATSSPASTAAGRCRPVPVALTACDVARPTVAAGLVPRRRRAVGHPDRHGEPGHPGGRRRRRVADQRGGCRHRAHDGAGGQPGRRGRAARRSGSPRGYAIYQATDRGLLLAPVSGQPGTTADELWDPADSADPSACSTKWSRRARPKSPGRRRAPDVPGPAARPGNGQDNRGRTCRPASAPR